MVTSSVIKAIVSVRRLSDFLHTKELQNSVQYNTAYRADPDGECGAVDQGCRDYVDEKDVQPVLEDINLMMHKGKLMAMWVLERCMAESCPVDESLSSLFASWVVYCPL